MPLTTLLAILVLVLLYFLLRRKHTKPDKLARFWKYPSKEPNRYPTIEDIRKKYPKRISNEQIRKRLRAKEDAEARRKQEIIDRHIREARASRESKEQ